MKSLQSLARIMLMDLGMMCSVDTARDVKTVTGRVEAEGDSFLTITLPTFAKDFDRSLAQGYVADDHFAGFRRNGGLPAFLRGFLQLVFDSRSGILLDEPSLEAIFAVRQFTMAFGKIFDLPTPRRQRDAMRQFIQTEQEVKAHVHRITGCPIVHYLWARKPRYEYNHDSGQVHLQGGYQGLRPLRVRALPASLDACGGLQVAGDANSGGDRNRPGDPRHLLRTLLPLWGKAAVLLYDGSCRTLDRSLERLGGLGDFTPQHGPGATADRRVGNGKYLLNEWPTRLEEWFPYLDWALPRRSLYDLQDRVTFLAPEQERPVRVISVPKTRKTPRIIAIEPTAMQYIQQALSRRIVESLEGNPLVGPMIGFTDQEPNQLMACEGSRDGSLATLDLSEASDRVPLLHVESLFCHWPSLRSAILACRSSKADVPEHGVHTLFKFASMGSALTFPVEAMLFLSIAIAAIAQESGSLPTMKFVKSLHGKVRVYGDDIIVPAQYAESVSAALEAFGLKVNRGKSFWTGLFRESCGGDFYAGVNVTPVRVRKKFPRTRKDAEEVASLVSLRNQFYEVGLWKTAGWLDKRIMRILPHYPIVLSTASLLGRRSIPFEPMAEYICADTHRPLVKGYEQVSKPPANELDDYFALMKWFLYKEQSPSGEPLAEDHLLRSGRANSTHLTVRRRTPY